jgi:hypothetical protein
MGFERLKFTKEWTDRGAFPTVETDEAKVRADMQVLHDEAKAGLNKLMDALEAAESAAKLGAVGPKGENSTVQQELDGLHAGMIKAGALPVGGSTNQMLIKSSDGNYATRWASIEEVIAVLRGVAGGVASLSEEGRIPAAQMPEYLHRANLLDTDTAAKFGLGSEAVLDDAFAAAKSLIDAVNANAETKAKIATGSYTGTGKYGSSNKNRLTFERIPKVLLIQRRDAPYGNDTFLILNGATKCANINSSGSVALCYLTFGANYVEWYNENNAANQANTQGAVYNYVAIS